MAPRKRKIESLGDGAVKEADGEQSTLRRSTRQKRSTNPVDDAHEGKIAPAPIAKTVRRKPKVTTSAKRGEKGKDAASPSSAKATDGTAYPLGQLSIPSSEEGGNPIACLVSYSSPPSSALVFTHGAGGDLSAAAMVNFSKGFASADPQLGLLMFPGNMNVKARAKGFKEVKRHETEEGKWYVKEGEHQEFILAYGGRSLGARAAVMASHADTDVNALVLASYPLMSPAGDVRDQILLDVAADVDVLFISGDRDSMCDLDRLEKVRDKMKARTWIVRVRGADHGMNVSGKKGKEGTVAMGEGTGKIAAKWILDRDADKMEMELSWDPEKGEPVGEWRAPKI